MATVPPPSPDRDNPEEPPGVEPALAPPDEDEPPEIEPLGPDFDEPDYSIPEIAPELALRQ